jgi:PAS domain S-box-containing protein
MAGIKDPHASNDSTINPQLEQAAPTPHAFSSQPALRLTQTLAHSPLPFVLTLPSTKIIACNQAYADLLGYSIEELKKIRALRLTEPHYHQLVERHLATLRSTGQPQLYQKEYIRKDGSRIAVHVAASLIENAEGDKPFFLGIVTNLANQQSEDAGTKQLPPASAETSADATLSITLDGTITSWNSRAEKYFGYSVAAACGQIITDIIPDINKRDVEHFLDIFRNTDQSIYYQAIRKPKDGAPIKVRVSCSPIRNLCGNLIGVTVSMRDLSEQHQLEHSRDTLLKPEHILARIGRALVNELDLNRVAQVILEQNLLIENVDMAGIYLADESKRQLDILAHNSVATPVQDLEPLFHRPLDQDSILTRAFLTGKYQFNNDMHSLQALSPETQSLFIRQGIGSILALPLKGEKGMVGVLVNLSQSSQTLSETEIKLRMMIADFFAVALEKARLHNALAEREQRVAYLLQKTIEIQEEERQQFSLNIQNGVAQTISNALQHLEQLRYHPQANPEMRDNVDELSSLLLASLHELHLLAAPINPDLLESAGLEGAVKAEVRSLIRLTGIPMEVELSSHQYPRKLEVGLYRLLTKPLKYWAASGEFASIRMTLGQQANVITISITLVSAKTASAFSAYESNSGMQAANDGPRPTGWTWGLRSARKAAEILGGTLEISDTGTQEKRVSIHIPMVEHYSQINPSIDEIQEPNRASADSLSKTIRVLIVDDHQVARRGLCSMLEEDQRIRVIGEASDGLEAVAKASELQPDVILMDVQMPKADGITATKLIKANQLSAAIVLMTSMDDDSMLRRALEAGASGCLLKSNPAKLLAQAIVIAAEGGTVWEDAVLQSALGAAANPHTAIPSAKAPNPMLLNAEPVLTNREKAVLKLVADGLTNKEIGQKLGFAEVSVKRSIQTTIKKLGATSRTQAVILAMRSGQID